MSELPVWLRSQYEYFLGLEERSRMPHAVLLQGRVGWGIERLASKFVSHALGFSGEASEAVHADLAWVEPVEISGGSPLESGGRTKKGRTAKTGRSRNQAIRIDQVRACTEFLSMMPQHGSFRYLVLVHADRMTVQAANALLKVLEEPPPGGRLLLLTERSDLLLPTISSRCQRIRVRAPTSDEALEWLQVGSPDAKHLDLYLREFGNAPYSILDAIEGGRGLIRDQLLEAWSNSATITARDTATEAERSPLRADWTNLDIFELLDRWQRLVHYLAMRQETGSEAHRFYQQLVEVKRLFGDIAGLNRRMQLERLLFQWCDLGRAVQSSRATPRGQN